MAHDHHHHHAPEGNLRMAFFLNLFFTIIEIIGGMAVNSVAIVSDAIHDLGDSLSLGTAWYLQRKSKQQADKQFSFGYARFSLLGALLNSVVLIIGSVFVIKEAVERLIHPEASDANGMLYLAILGIAVNGYAAWKMTSGKSLNEKVISWHLMEDVLGWAAVLIVAIVLQFKQIDYLDPALSLAITLYILYGVFKRLKETLFLFLQGVPAEFDLKKLEAELLAVNGVEALHHTHIWSLEGEHHVFSSHVRLKGIQDLAQMEQIKLDLKKQLAAYHFNHITLELETEGQECSMK